MNESKMPANRHPGNMGISILNGLLSSLEKGQQTVPHVSEEDPIRFIACVNHFESVERLRNRVRNRNGTKRGEVEIWVKRNVAAVKASDIVLLACQPSQAGGILSEVGMKESLANKLVLSICVGLSVSKLEHLIRGGKSEAANSDQYHLLQAMPNTASSVRQSATIFSTGDAVLPEDLQALAIWVMQSIGTVTQVESSAMPAASVAAASTPAFIALAIDGMIQGAVAEGLDEEATKRMVAQAMKGTAELILQGDNPGQIREKVMTPNGCTARGVGVLEAGSVQQTFSESIRQAISRVYELADQS